LVRIRLLPPSRQAVTLTLMRTAPLSPILRSIHFRTLWILPWALAGGERAVRAADLPALPEHLPHVQVDVPRHQVRVDCQAVKATYPLEFVAVRTNTNEYEALVHTDARPSDLHLALLFLGLQPGTPIHFDPATNTWLPPTGPLLNLRFEYVDHGKTINVPAWAWMRDVNTRQAATGYQWCFTGSQISNGVYAADATGSLIGLINNPVSVIDVPALKSRALDARQWERNGDAMPATNTPVTLIISPAAAPAAPASSAPTTAASTAPASQPR
jgi:hypothetical protein